MILALRNVVNYGSVCPTAKPLPDDLRHFVEDPRSNGKSKICYKNYKKWLKDIYYVFKIIKL